MTHFTGWTLRAKPYVYELENERHKAVRSDMEQVGDSEVARRNNEGQKLCFCSNNDRSSWA